MSKSGIHEKFCDRMVEISNDMNIKYSTKTKRKKLLGLKDRVVFLKAAWGVAESWAGLPRAVIYWLALTPIAIANFNEFLKFTGASFAVPLGYGSMMAVGFVIGLMIFGYTAWRHLGIRKSTEELSNKQSPAYVLLYAELQQVKEGLARLEKMIKNGGKLK